MPGKVFGTGGTDAMPGVRREGRSIVWANIAKFSQVENKGSEPSLVSANGQRSTASKRNLISADNTNSFTHQTSSTSDIPTKPLFNSDSQLNHTDTSKSSWDSIGVSTTPPAYVRLSCAVSGYNNRYNSNSPAKLKVIKKSPPPQNKDSVDETDCARPNLNGHQMNGHSLDTNGHVTQNGGLLQNCEILTHSRTELSETKSGEKRYCTSVNVRPASLSGSVSSSSLSSAEGDNTGSKQKKPPINESLRLDLSGISTSDEKDGHYFLNVVQQSEDHIKSWCAHTEQHLTSQEISEEVSGILRAAIGKASLLINKKFKQFRGLCQQNIDQTGDEPFCTTAQDLEGFWDMVMLQNDDVESMFKEIEEMRANNWKQLKKKTHVRRSSSGASSVQTTPRSANTVSKTAKSPRGKENLNESTGQSERAAKAQEAAKAREEARKRLMQAKRAGRRRKASDNSKEIEIFMAE